LGSTIGIIVLQAFADVKAGTAAADARCTFAL
jgi:hypothetical protein